MEIINENAAMEATAKETAPKSKKGLVGALIGLGVGAAALVALAVKSVTKKNDSDEVIECEDYTEACAEEDSE